MNIFKSFQDRRRIAKLKASLMEAAARGDIGAVIAMLDDGLDVNTDDCGLTALIAAATEGHAGLVEVLLARGANPNVADEEHAITALMQAAASGDVRTVQLLMAAGANVNDRDWMDRTALDYADNGGIADLLRGAGAKNGPGESSGA